jgi:glutamine amidotransferase
MNEPTITMIDYGGSNLRSALKALEAVGGRVEVTSDPDVARRAEKAVLPGVGAFGSGMDALRARGLIAAAREVAGRGVPFLGICIGMQFLFDESEEMGSHEGLGLLPGRVVRFPASVDGADRPLKVPHVGWNQIEHDGRHPLLAGIAPGSHAYFVHSYYCLPEDPAAVLGATNYGVRFAAVVGRDNVMGLQFHPEKSQQVGLRILRNFVNMR